MIGSRVGSQGPLVGSSVGSSADDEGGDAVTWTVDDTSGIAVPATATEWDDFIAANGLTISRPESLWLCQEASGNLADSIGSLSLVGVNTPIYQQAVAGWSRKAVGTTDGSTARFRAAAGSGPSPATTSITWLAIALLPPTPAANRSIIGYNVTASPDSVRALHLVTTGLPQLQVDGFNQSGGNAVSSEVHALVLKYDRTGSEAKFYTLDEKITGSYSATVVDGDKGTGSGTASLFVYMAMWSGASAEIADAQIKALKQAMGFAPAWS